KYVATPDYDVVVDALLACGGEAVERELRNRWADESADSALYSYLVSKFLTTRLRADSVAFFVGKGGDDQKGGDAKKIARAALDLAGFASDSVLQEANAAFQQKAKLYGKAWSIKGGPVARQGGLVWGDNHQFKLDAGVYTPLPDWTKGKKHTLVLHFLPLSDDSCEVGYGSTQGVWSVIMQAGKGVIVPDDKSE